MQDALSGELTLGEANRHVVRATSQHENDRRCGTLHAAGTATRNPGSKPTRTLHRVEAPPMEKVTKFSGTVALGTAALAVAPALIVVGVRLVRPSVFTLAPREQDI